MTGAGARSAIPNKLYFRIGEVSEITGVQPYTLRHWEMEFPTLSPKKNDAGQRLYRREDIEMVGEIQRLLHLEGYTTAGARRLLTARKRAGKRATGPGTETAARSPAKPPPAAGSPSGGLSDGPPGSRPPTPPAASGAPGPTSSGLSPEDLRRVREALDRMDENDRTLARILASPPV